MSNLMFKIDLLCGAVITLNNDYQEILQRFREMRLPIMAEQLLLAIENGDIETISSHELLDRMTANEWMTRKNNTVRRLKKKAKLSQPMACIEEIDHSASRKLNEKTLAQISTDIYIRNHRNIVILGACGTGKSYLCNALGNRACEKFYSVLYCRLFELLETVNQAHIETGTVTKAVNKYVKPDVLIIDDFLINSVQDKEAEYLYRILEYRQGCKSTIIGSQLEPKEWHKNLGGNELADAVLDRLLSCSYKMILSGESLRKNNQE